MSTLYTRVRNDQLTARRSGEKVAAALLTTLLSEAGRVGKDAGGREPTDAETVTVIRKFLKNNDEVLRLRPDDAAAQQERGILTAFLPEPLSDEQVRDYILHAFNADQRSMKHMKLILGALEAQFPGQVTGQQVATILKGL